AAPRLRPHDRGRQRPLRAGRPTDRLLRWRLRSEPAGECSGHQEGEGDLVSVPAVLRRGGAADGARERRRAAGAAGGGGRGLLAGRVRTLPAAIAPVLVGTSLALGAGHFHALAFVAALLGAIFIQVGTNLSNDYADARRGADTEDRLGPVRVTAGGLVPPRQV